MSPEQVHTCSAIQLLPLPALWQCRATPALTDFQLMDERITPKSDVYSFAIMMWEVATRMHPWHKMSALAVMRKVVDEGLRPTVVPVQQVGVAAQPSLL